MSWLNDVESLLVAAGVGTPGLNIFTSTAAKVPTGAGPYLSMIEYPGDRPVRTHDTAPGAPNEIENFEGDAYHEPAAQILTRADTYRKAKEMAVKAYRALNRIRNQEINGVWYSEIRALQIPSDFGRDDTNRPQVVFNVRGFKRPS